MKKQYINPQLNMVMFATVTAPSACHTVETQPQIPVQNLTEVDKQMLDSMGMGVEGMEMVPEGYSHVSECYHTAVEQLTPSGFGS